MAEGVELHGDQDILCSRMAYMKVADDYYVDQHDKEQNLMVASWDNQIDLIKIFLKNFRVKFIQSKITSAAMIWMINCRRLLIKSSMTLKVIVIISFRCPNLILRK